MSLAFLWFAASSGGLSLLTPCVFPMVPITVSYFSQHSAGSRRVALRNTLVFAAAIIGTFTALGLALAVFAGAAGLARFAANPWVNLGLAAIFAAFALALFGVYSVTIPSRWLTAIDAATRRHDSAGIVGALLTGVMFTLTSFTCTAPFVGTVLVTAAQGQWLRPVAGMLVYSTAFALPFFVLALMPQWMARVPRSGRWLQSVKVVMGLAELAAAIKFLANADLVWHWGLITRDVVIVWFALLAIASAIYFLRRNAAGTLVGVATALWLARGLVGRSLGALEAFLPPDRARAALQWRVNDYASALADARRDHRLVFIDFTGYTCTNCRWMEANMFVRPEIETALRQYVLARLFTDGDGPVYEAQQKLQERQFGTVALPMYAIVDGNGTTVATFAGLTRDPAGYLAFLVRRGN